MRQCPFAGCEAQLPDHLFACRPHWFSLRKADQLKIHAAYNDYLKDLIDLETLRSRQQEVLGDRGAVAQLGEHP